MRLHLRDAASTDALGRALAHVLPAPAVVHLHGDLGAGKSSLARALLRELGVQGAIRSPTYTLVERYTTPRGEAWHLDLYRIADAGELDYLGLDAADPVLWLVEWPERGRAGLPPPDLEIALEISGEGRDVALTPRSPGGAAALDALRDAFTAADLHG